MSEVQKILRHSLPILKNYQKKLNGDTSYSCGVCGEGWGTTRFSTEEAEQALYNLLMEKMPKERNRAKDFTHVPVPHEWSFNPDTGEYTSDEAHNGAVKQMRSAIKKLFGRTE